jgi:hypothetical protein
MAAYMRAAALERTRPSTGARRGFGLYEIRPDSIQARDVAAEPGAHLVIGRHTACDLVVSDPDPMVSLRHVLVRTFALDDGLPILSVLDLDSHSGFELADGSRQRAIVASGPFAFRIGSTWFVALPIGEPLPDELGSPVIRHAEDGSYASCAPSRQRISKSFITLVPWSVSIDSRATGVWTNVGDAPFELFLETKGRCASVRFTERDVAHGILIGRSGKCADANLRAVLEANEHTSRVHALVIRERSGIVLHDVASMNGTLNTQGCRVRSMLLPDRAGEDECFSFGGKATTSVRWRVRS